MPSEVSSESTYRLDVADILYRLQSDWTLLEELCGILLEEMPGMLDRIRKAVQSGNAGEIHRAAHYLKGSVGVFGPGPHTEAAARLEKAAQENRLEKVDSTWRDLEECMTGLMEAVRALKEKAHDRSDSRG